MTTESKLLLGRLLTRSGDHAWDFAVPLALLTLFPGRLQIAAVYYLVSKILMLLLTPACGRWIDRSSQRRTLQGGIVTQSICVVMAGGLFGALTFCRGDFSEPQTLVLFALLILAGVGAALGGMILDIFIGNNLVPSLVAPEGLTRFNSLLRRVDLVAEVLSPLLAGLLLSLHGFGTAMFGFYLIVLWNLFSFLPEYLLLESILMSGAGTASPARQPEATLGDEMSQPFWRRIFRFEAGALAREPLAFVLGSYSLLWLSVLSPHGVLLTGYLKDGVHMPEFQMGVFRGLGALFGLLSTVTFPFLVKRLNLNRGSQWHLGFQMVTVVIASLLFFFRDHFSIEGFLFLILCSRVGLYGFSNGEFEIRQRLIAPDQRGRVNALGSAMNTIATLITFGVASFLPSTADFAGLVYFSGIAVVASFVLFHCWTRTASAEIPAAGEQSLR